MIELREPGPIHSVTNLTAKHRFWHIMKGMVPELIITLFSSESQPAAGAFWISSPDPSPAPLGQRNRLN
jgi:hypothetical protein